MRTLYYYMRTTHLFAHLFSINISRIVYDLQRIHSLLRWNCTTHVVVATILFRLLHRAAGSRLHFTLNPMLRYRSRAIRLLLPTLASSVSGTWRSCRKTSSFLRSMTSTCSSAWASCVALLRSLPPRRPLRRRQQRRRRPADPSTRRHSCSEWTPKRATVRSSPTSSAWTPPCEFANFLFHTRVINI